VKQLLGAAILCVSLTGCTTYYPTIPEDYEGPSAVIEDSENRIDSGKADLFYLSHVNKKPLRNSRKQSLTRSYGMGNFLTTILLKHTVAAEEQTFSIVGRTTYAMPGRALLGTVYELKGDVVFSPQPDASYVIKGELQEEGSSVWIENVASGEVVRKIEVEGPSKLGFFEK
jgi:hypothetical protein